MFSYLINLIDYTNKLKILNFFKKKLNNHFVNIIDVGAHKGETINFFFKNFNINKIFVFEPNRNLYKILIKKFKHKKKIFIFNYGVGFKNEKKILNISIDSSSSTINKINTNTDYFKRKKKILTFGKNTPYFVSEQKIEIVNLSDFILNNETQIDVLKIDTEGYELKVLKGINKSDLRKIKFIYFEHHYDLMIDKGYKFKDINEFLKMNNFTLKFKLRMKFRKSFEYIYESN
jgi:FkbM family methyltransferase